MRSLCVLVVICILVKCFASEVRQEGAKINFCNKKYVSECFARTQRVRRGEPYKSNVTAVTKDTWGNNVTIKIELYGGTKLQLVKTRLCDSSKIDWFYDYLITYGHIDGNCPYKPGEYGLYDIEFPPKKWPIKITSLVNGNFQIRGYFLVTSTEEVIVDTTVTFRTIT